MKSIIVFDTETSSLEKPFCYNAGYRILNAETFEKLIDRDFVCEQVWHNPMLFTTAYYADKRDLYIKAMRKRQAIMDKFGYVCQQIIRDIKAYNVIGAYAFNSKFDEKVFNFNCDWFKCNNPFDNIPIFDIRGYAHRFLVDKEYLEFCDKHSFYTDSGNYSTTAETFFAYLTQNSEYKEEHTALADSIIESDILIECLKRGAILNEDYQALRSIEKKQPKILTLIDRDNKTLTFNCNGYTVYKNKDMIKLK